MPQRDFFNGLLGLLPSRSIRNLRESFNDFLLGGQRAVEFVGNMLHGKRGFPTYRACGGWFNKGQKFGGTLG